MRNCSTRCSIGSLLRCVGACLLQQRKNRLDRWGPLSSAVEQVAAWMGFLLQPWTFVAVLVELTLSLNVQYRSVTAAVVTSLISACLLFPVLRAIASHRLSWFVAMTIGLCVLAGISIYSFKIDMEVVEKAIYDGP